MRCEEDALPDRLFTSRRFVTAVDDDERRLGEGEEDAWRCAPPPAALPSGLCGLLPLPPLL